jgi:MOSC domain-containing protein YiiM
MGARVVQINISPKGGVPKRPVAEARVTPFGIEGDGHAHPNIHGGPRKAVLLLAAETVDALRERGYPVFDGALGENFTTRGIDPKQLRIGQQVRIGEVLIELTAIRRPCSTLDIYGPAIKDEIYDEQVKAGDPSSPRWGWSGFYGAVLRPGTVRPGDIVAVETTLA